MAEKPVVNFERYPETRIDWLTGDAVSIVPNRNLLCRRKTDLDRQVSYENLPTHDPSCPFCPGNEDKTPPEILRIPTGSNGQWSTRLFDNKFPLCLDEEPKNWKSKGPFDAYRSPVVGAHRVIVGSPVHNHGLTHMGPAGIARMLETVAHCYFDFGRDSRFTSFSCFGNYGTEAAASQKHLHWQVVAGCDEELIFARHPGSTRKIASGDGSACLACKWMERERELGLLVAESDDLAALVPFAAAYPYQIRLFPKRHYPSYPIQFQNKPQVLVDCARILHESMRRIKRCVQDGMGNWQDAPDPPYNIVFNTAPYPEGPESFFHWHIDILPRTTRQGGYEMATRRVVNPTIPEEVAEQLRLAKIQ